MVNHANFSTRSLVETVTESELKNHIRMDRHTVRAGKLLLAGFEVSEFIHDLFNHGLQLAHFGLETRKRFLVRDGACRSNKWV